MNVVMLGVIMLMLSVVAPTRLSNCDMDFLYITFVGVFSFVQENVFEFPRRAPNQIFLKAHVHCQSFETKTSAISSCDITIDIKRQK